MARCVSSNGILIKTQKSYMLLAKHAPPACISTGDPFPLRMHLTGLAPHASGAAPHSLLKPLCWSVLISFVLHCLPPLLGPFLLLQQGRGRCGHRRLEAGSQCTPLGTLCSGVPGCAAGAGLQARLRGRIACKHKDV